MPTPRMTQEQILEAIRIVNEYGSVAEAARRLNIPRETLRNRYSARTRLEQREDVENRAPDGHYVKGVSTYYDADGQVKGQWVKTSVDAEQREKALRAAIEGLAASIDGLAPLAPKPLHSDSDLMSVYPMGDPHFGLYAYADETGDNFDLSIAEEITKESVDRLVSSSPPSKTGLLLNLGDAFHADDSSNQTPSSGHALDVDTRFAKVAQVGLKTLVHCARRMLEKHEKVIVWNMPGNHDPHSALWLAIAMDAFFSNEPRIEVDLSPSLYKFIRFGKVLIGSHHGHGAKPNDLPLLMAADRPKDWGETEFRHWLCGHIHHWTAKEHPGVVVESFRTLAGKDAWHAGKGYRSRRDMNCIVYHSEYGEVQRIRCDVVSLGSAR